MVVGAVTWGDGGAAGEARSYDLGVGKDHGRLAGIFRPWSARPLPSAKTNSA
jgi:hypothetical protein